MVELGMVVYFYHGIRFEAGYPLYLTISNRRCTPAEPSFLFTLKNRKIINESCCFVKSYWNKQVKWLFLLPGYLFTRGSMLLFWGNKVILIHNLWTKLSIVSQFYEWKYSFIVDLAGKMKELTLRALVPIGLLLYSNVQLSDLSFSNQLKVSDHFGKHEYLANIQTSFSWLRLNLVGLTFAPM